MSDKHKQLRLLCLATVSGLTSLSKTSIYCIQDFPKPIKIQGVGASAQSGARWVESEVYAWINSRIQLRDNNPAPSPAQQKTNTLELVS
jgi:predicted DNA-binding transcriptional regulator AlpA